MNKNKLIYSILVAVVGVGAFIVSHPDAQVKSSTAFDDQVVSYPVQELETKQVEAVEMPVQEVIPQPEPVVVKQTLQEETLQQTEPTYVHEQITPEPDYCTISWYGNEFNGNLTASGEVFDENAMTAAHKSLPFGTRIRLSANGNSIELTVNDRTPQSFMRCFDVSKGAFQQLAPLDQGVILVTYEVL